LRRGDTEEAVALDPVHDVFLEDRGDDDAGAGERGEEGEEECCGLHLVFSFLFLFFLFVRFLCFVFRDFVQDDCRIVLFTAVASLR
jgi:hypothetical protein